ncbi:basic form of pathogenesis-related protein 1-like [Cucumis melo var. makuwa]|uniref:Basic form of pathogenesis-related protein 1-like n=2 Tax=Cucumis melo TaxID=3656 RepID=A0A1S3C012_CUCME|nr:basic form of pathogenesis-related protein 1-like [Cucumis melo]KAA0031390.1 basic form of pathogenesis-related protein 1-like [Cucumis melo var. makuwa]TYK06841.1 basic form of pathogenesis-related protein 1-like [Cucumis melo var. makuwa]
MVSSTIIILSTICLVSFLLATTISNAQNSPQDFVDTHNDIRAAVGVGPVSWDDTLAAYAQSYADSKIDTCEMEHSNGPYGENLAEGYDEMTGVEAVKFWATEKKFYNHHLNRCVGDECGHYTQIVWRHTTNIGCGRVKCENNWVFVICNYNPPGNYIGQHPY